MVAHWNVGTRTMVAFLFGGWILLSGLLFHSQLPLNRGSADPGGDGAEVAPALGLRSLRSERVSESSVDVGGREASQHVNIEGRFDGERQGVKASGLGMKPSKEEPYGSEPNRRQVDETDESVQNVKESSHSEGAQAEQVLQIEDESKEQRSPAEISSPQKRLFPPAYVDKLRKRVLSGLKRYDDGVRLMIVTGEQAHACESKQGSHLIMKAYKNKQDYCMLHGCRVWYSLELYDENYRGVWARYPLLQRLMRAFPNIEWFVWMDADAIFTDMSFSIPLQDYKDRHMVVPGWAYLLFKENPDWAGGLNAGVFLIRNSEWSYQFLERWIAMGQKDVQEKLTKIFNEEFPTRPKTWPADDQSSLAHMIRANEHNESKYLHLESRYVLHGFWEAIVDLYEGMVTKGWGDEKSSGWPFVSHFCGCKMCVVDDGSEYVRRCIQNFDRGYHFADDQVLALTNARHINLNTSRIVSTASH